MDDNLRQLLAQIDPVPAYVAVDDAGSIRARTLLEEIMSTPINTTTAKDTGPGRAQDGRRRVPMLIGGVAAAAIAAIAVVVLVVGDDDAPASRQTLAVAAPGTTMSSCLPFDVNVLAEMPVAFAGTVTEMSDTTVTVEVDRWYRASTGETDLVDVTLPEENTSAALDGVDFATGQRYLLTATDGTVNGCGFSGPATSELESAFASAFPE